MSDTFVKDYKTPNHMQQETSRKTKELAEALEAQIKITGEYGADKRCIAVALTNLETAIMWATKGVMIAEGYAEPKDDPKV